MTTTDPTIPTYDCRRLREPPPFDGDFEGKAWRGTDIQQLVNVAAPSTLVRWSVAFRAGWNDTHLFVAFLCADPDIWGTYSERDDPIYDEEVVEAFLCPTGDLRHYYELEVNPHNAVFDATVYSPDLHRGTMKVDTAWTCEGLQTAVHAVGTVHRTPPSERHATADRDNPLDRWTAELAIPFAAFPEAGAPRPGDAWRANFYRIERAGEPEYSAWSATMAQDFHVPLRFGELRFAAG